MKKVNYPQAIQILTGTSGINADDVGEIVEQTEVVDGETTLWYTFRIFSPDTEEMFALAASLGHLFGPKNVSMQEYGATQKYRGHATIEISVKQ